MQIGQSHYFGIRKELWALLVLAVLSLGASGQAFAQATRTWVSGVGDDANPCSRTAPCKTFAGAISKTAVGGEINAMDSGGFGTVTITKSITIDGGAGNIAGALSSSTSAMIINAPADAKIILRNLDINGAPATAPGLIGVRIANAASVLIENSKIYNFSTAGVQVLASSAGTKVSIHNSTLNGNTLAISNLDTANGSVIYLSNSTVFDNTNAFDIPAEGNITSFNTNRLVGNGTIAAPDTSMPTNTVYER